MTRQGRTSHGQYNSKAQVQHSPAQHTVHTTAPHSATVSNNLRLTLAFEILEKTLLFELRRLLCGSTLKLVSGLIREYTEKKQGWSIMLNRICVFVVCNMPIWAHVDFNRTQ
jgi:hypothetical protein